MASEEAAALALRGRDLALLRGFAFVELVLASELELGGFVMASPKDLIAKRVAL